MIGVRRSMMTLLLCLCSAILVQGQTPPKFADIDNIGNRDINEADVDFVSRAREVALGRQLAAEIERQVKPFDDPVVAEYVNRMGQNLVNSSDAKKMPFRIEVVDSSEVNALSLPGGFIFIHTGIILAADDEAELAAVIARQIAHVAARHSTELVSKAQLVDFGAIPGMFDMSYSYSDRAERSVPAQFARLVQNDALEADYLGVQYLYKAGYDPGAAVRFLKKLRNGAAPAVRTHPPASTRIAALEENIALVLPRREQNVVTSLEFESIKKRVSDRGR